MSNIRTAEEFLVQETLFQEVRKYGYVTEEGALRMMREFAKMHVEKALASVHRSHQLPEEDFDFTRDSYPLSNIV